MKILITGAHFTPAVATAEQLRKIGDVEIVYVGRKTTLEGDKSPSQESRVLPAMGIEFIPIITGRLQRTFTLYTIPSLFKIPIGFIQAIYIILRQKPDVILSFGGYVAVPVVITGWLFSIPIIVHEQTLVSGLANKISALFADKIALSFQNQPLGKKTFLTGNPIREEILHPKEKAFEYQKLFNIAKKERLPVILIMGGNQGSHVINLAIEEVLDKLNKIACVIHVTGENKFGDFERLGRLGRSGPLRPQIEARELGGRYLVKKWIGTGYGTVLSKVDLVISRAGINTLTELAILGKPALVIPIPYLYQDEQMKNAKYFENFGFISVLPQSKLSSESLLKNIKIILKNLDIIKLKAKEAKKVVTDDAAKRLALETILLGNNR